MSKNGLTADDFIGKKITDPEYYYDDGEFNSLKLETFEGDSRPYLSEREIKDMIEDHQNEYIDEQLTYKEDDYRAVYEKEIGFDASKKESEDKAEDDDEDDEDEPEYDEDAFQDWFEKKVREEADELGLPDDIDEQTNWELEPRFSLDVDDDGTILDVERDMGLYGDPGLGDIYWEEYWEDCDEEWVVSILLELTDPSNAAKREE